jgi:tRNA (cmo5U34)-methyltransferase
LKIATGFNRLAPFYTLLTRIVFGKVLRLAQEHFIASIYPGDHVLILGGGSGELLKALLKQQPRITIDYIDISEKMIQLARRKTKNPSTVNFIIGTEQDIPNQTYAVVITNFYLDLFSDNTLQRVIQKIKIHLSPGGQWLVTDFVAKKQWHKVMLWGMYRFFRIVASIEARSLPHWEHQFAQAGLTQRNTQDFFGHFIKSSCFRVVY